MWTGHTGTSPYTLSSLVHRTDTLLLRLSLVVGKEVFYAALWGSVLASPSVRLPASLFVVSHINRDVPGKEQKHMLGTDHRLTVGAALLVGAAGALGHAGRGCRRGCTVALGSSGDVQSECVMRSCRPDVEAAPSSTWGPGIRCLFLTCGDLCTQASVVTPGEALLGTPALEHTVSCQVHGELCTACAALARVAISSSAQHHADLHPPVVVTALVLPQPLLLSKLDCRGSSGVHPQSLRG